MPPLVWREKIWICPVCLERVGPEDLICETCGAEFESPLGKKLMRSRPASTAEVLWLATVVSTSFLSFLFLVIALFLSELHKLVPPIHENAILYSTALIFVILASMYFIHRNGLKEKSGEQISPLARAAPFAAVLTCAVALMLVAFAKDVDRIISGGTP